MIMYWREIIVNWGESDPFGLVYYPRIMAWFNDTEHELFRSIGFPIDKMIKNDRVAFVMGEVHFRFIGPASYGDCVKTIIELNEIRDKTLHWNCNAVNVTTGDLITEGRATRVYARINEDGTLSAKSIPENIAATLRNVVTLDSLSEENMREVTGSHLNNKW